MLTFPGSKVNHDKLDFGEIGGCCLVTVKYTVIRLNPLVTVCYAFMSVGCRLSHMELKYYITQSDQLGPLGRSWYWEKLVL